jgi:hypothetical protein
MGVIENGQLGVLMEIHVWADRGCSSNATRRTLNVPLAIAGAKERIHADNPDGHAHEVRMVTPLLRDDPVQSLTN